MSKATLLVPALAIGLLALPASATSMRSGSEIIDEGHKGQKSEDAKWKTVREKLAEDGFIWEYSATFGQTITSRKSPYFEEYKYSILFDYSYKYFHQDGYGKDFNILNLSTSKFLSEDITDRVSVIK